MEQLNGESIMNVRRNLITYTLIRLFGPSCLELKELNYIR